MASLSASASWSVEQLLEAVAHLAPAEQREFQRRLAARQAQNGSQGSDPSALLEAAHARLPATAERRLKRLAAKSERGQLTPLELADYQSLAQEAQRLDAVRAEALAERARRRGPSVPAGNAAGERKGRRDAT